MNLCCIWLGEQLTWSQNLTIYNVKFIHYLYREWKCLCWSKTLNTANCSHCIYNKYKLQRMYDLSNIILVDDRHCFIYLMYVITPINWYRCVWSCKITSNRPMSLMYFATVYGYHFIPIFLISECSNKDSWLQIWTQWSAQNRLRTQAHLLSITPDIRSNYIPMKQEAGRVLDHRIG